MAINLGQNVNVSQKPMLNLQKGQMLNLTKKEPGLKNVILGAGWDVARNSSGWDFDLDIAAFLCKSDGKVHSVEDVVFFNNKSVKGVTLEGDNRTGAGEGDDERIQIQLDDVDSSVERIVFSVTIYEAVTRCQTFGLIDNSYVRLLDKDKNEREICRFNLKQDSSRSTAIIFAELIKQQGEWTFHAIGEGRVGDLNTLLSLYM